MSTTTSKSEHKLAAAAQADGGYEQTTFGRRPISRWPKVLVTVGGMLAVPFVLIYRRLRRVA